MFVKNFKSIKRKIVCVNEMTKDYLIQNGHSPVSKNEDNWIYIANKKILSLIEGFNGGDG